MATPFTLTDATFSSPRHTTHYWKAGPAGGPLMIFLHGWPQIGLVWRAQVEAFASEGWHCIAPDMRGYGGSSAPSAPEAYALRCASERGLRTVLGAADFFMEHF